MQALPKHQEVKHGKSGYLHARDKTGCILQLTPFSLIKKGAAGVVSTQRDSGQDRDTSP